MIRATYAGACALTPRWIVVDSDRRVALELAFIREFRGGKWPENGKNHRENAASADFRQEMPRHCDASGPQTARQ